MGQGGGRKKYIKQAGAELCQALAAVLSILLSLTCLVCIHILG